MSEWKTYTMEEVIEHFIDYRGKTPKKTTYGIPLITAKIVKKGFIEEPDEFIAEDYYDSWMRRGLPEIGDVVMTTEAPLGEVAQIKTSAKIALGQRIITLRGKTDLLDNTFLRFILQGATVQGRLKARGTGSTVQGIKSSELKKVQIDLPPLPEQKKIARVLGNIDDKIELNRQMNKTLEAMAMTLYRHYFIDFGLPPGVKHETDESPFGKLCDTDELGPIPEGWGIGKISDILFLEYGKSLPDHKRIVGDYPVYGSNGIVGYHNEYISEGPGIIVGRKGTAGQVIRAEKNFFPIDTTFFVKPKIDYYSMNTLYLILIHQKLKEMNFDSAVPGLNRNNAYDIDCIIPPQNVVKDFSKKIDQFFTLIDNMNNEIPLLINTREYLLPKLISGEVKVQ